MSGPQRSTHLILGLFLTVVSGASCFAASPARDGLESANKELESSRATQKEIDDKLKTLQKDMEQIQEQGVKLAASIRTKEEQIDEQNEKLGDLQKHYETKAQALHLRRKDGGKLLQAMIRMQRMPKEFVIATPNKMDDLLRTASALNVSYSAADHSMKQLGAQLHELSELQKTISLTQQNLKNERLQLKNDQKELELRIAERQKLRTKLTSEQEAINARIALLSKQSSSLHDLVGKLRDDEQLSSSMNSPKSKPSPVAPDKNKSFSDMKGAIPYPTSGKILHRFGDKKGINDRYNGTVLLTTASAQVTAPYSGRVVFTGQFMDYGNMVIIQHNNVFHSLVAGLNRIDVEPGQQVITGEPVGVMGNTAPTQELYLEIRKNSKAIDPAAWMGNLKRSLAAN